MSVQVKHNSKLADLINYKLRVVAQDGRVYIGELLAFDKHMNVVLGDCVEECVLRRELDSVRRTGVEKAELKVKKRVLGLVILRGEQILSTLVEDKPLQTKKERIVVETKEKKQLAKQKNQRKKNSNTNGKVTKPHTEGRYNNTSNNNKGMPAKTTQPVKKFQPPPGFKRK